LPLDRQDIERRDFPIGRRGYEPEAVDAHLRALASEVESLKRARSGGGSESLASAASEQVRAIVEAAESSAADIEREAEGDARSARDRAAADAQQTRDEAAAQAREHVTAVSESTQVMLQRVDAMESELGALMESLRTGANRLTADLTLLQGNMGELHAAAGHGSSGSTEAPASLPSIPRPIQVDDEDEPQAYDEEPDERDEPLPAAGGDDSEGARLIALNMALNGTPRDETDQYLAENFDLDDRSGLLDEVYSRVG
jgi:hypothetical protein